MDEYISKDTAVKALLNMEDWDGAGLVVSIPAAEVAPRETGQWNNGVCRDCGKKPDDLRRVNPWNEDWHYWEHMPPFCPNCGRRMTVERWSNENQVKGKPWNEKA